MSDLDAMTAALRASADDAPVDATSTRLKIRESLAPKRSKRFGWLFGGGLLFAGSVSWALATGQVQRFFTTASAPVTAPATVAAPASASVTVTATAAVPASAAAPGPAAASAAVPAPAAVPASAAAPAPAPTAHELKNERSFIKSSPVGVERPVELEPLYKRAHELHFHGADATASLAAWDAYLAKDPNGRFAIEARYNRAVDLIKLDRLAEAQQALAPFAAGEVEPKGYRQAEAAELVNRIAKRLNGSK